MVCQRIKYDFIFFVSLLLIVASALVHTRMKQCHTKYSMQKSYKILKHMIGHGHQRGSASIFQLN